MELEKMNDFFNKRINEYDEHMLKNFGNGYIKLASLIPRNINNILDIGCGTGLELNEIFRKLPQINIVGIDLNERMLEKLKQKYFDKNIELINSNYLNYNFGEDIYDLAISYETLHHLNHDEKTKLYKKVYKTLKNNTQYIECDYMVIEQSEEDKYFKEYEELKTGNKRNEIYHYDTPCTIENQIKMLKNAGFKEVEMVWREEDTAIIIAKKI
jgi:ubiquinone/menaquinone biosynthesis C-methylase UbiE